MTKPYVIWPYDWPTAMHVDLETGGVEAKPFSRAEHQADYIIIYRSQFERYAVDVASSDTDR